MKIRVIIPTNGKRQNLINKTIKSLNAQACNREIEIIVVSEQPLDSGLLFSNVRVMFSKDGAGILRNIAVGNEGNLSQYTLLLDDDMVFESRHAISNLVYFIERNPSVYAVGPFIDEFKGSKYDIKNRIFDSFKRLFSLWDPESPNHRVISCFGKECINHRDSLQSDPIVGTQWLSNAALLIRTDILRYYLRDVEYELNSVYPFKKVWASDLFLTHRMYLDNPKALAFIPSVSVLHLGALNTSFSVTNRVVLETLAGFYFYKRYFSVKGIFSFYVKPCIGRLIDILFFKQCSVKSRVLMLLVYLGSFGSLAGFVLQADPIPAYRQDKFVCIYKTAVLPKLSY